MSDVFEIEASALQTERLLLRKPKIDDAPQVFEYAADPEVARYTLWPPHKNEAFTRGFLKFFTAPAVLSWALLLKENQQLIGMAVFHSLDKHHAKAEISFNLARKVWGQGIAFEVGHLLLDFAFQSLKLNRIEATCMPENLGSKRVLQKLGLRYEGTMRKSHRRYDGFHDMELHAVLASDWKTESNK